MNKVTKKELLRRIEALEEWSNGADEMLTELNHALPDPEYDAKCEERAVAVEESLARHAVRLGLKKPELTGSDLCRAMLERGGKFVMCHVGINKNITVITGWNGNGFTSVTNQDSLYLNPTPINNQGEPLTQLEAGL